MKSRFALFATSYRSAILKAPLRTKMFTNLAIGCLGDFLCQTTMHYYNFSSKPSKESEKTTGLDPVRTLRQGTVSMTLKTVALHVWLTRALPWLVVSPKLIAKPSLNRLATCLLRVLAHTSILMPYMTGATLFGIGSLQTFTLTGGVKNCRDNFRDGYNLAWMYWPLIMMGLYYWVPPLYGNLYMDLWNVLWGAIISYVANRKH